MIMLTSARCLGGKVSDFEGDVAQVREVGVAYTLAGARAFAKSLAPRIASDRKFTFVFCSGRGAEQNASRNLWFMKDTRYIKVRPNLDLDSYRRC